MSQEQKEIIKKKLQKREPIIHYKKASHKRAKKNTCQKRKLRRIIQETCDKRR